MSRDIVLPKQVLRSEFFLVIHDFFALWRHALPSTGEKDARYFFTISPRFIESQVWKKMHYFFFKLKTCIQSNQWIGAWIGAQKVRFATVIYFRIRYEKFVYRSNSLCCSVIRINCCGASLTLFQIGFSLFRTVIFCYFRLTNNHFNDCTKQTHRFVLFLCRHMVITLIRFSSQYKKRPFSLTPQP